MTIQLMTDSSADLPLILKDKLHVEIVPLYLHFSDGQYTCGQTMNIESFHQKVKKLGELPRSSAPSPSDFYEAYKKIPSDKQILMLSISGEISSTYANAVAAKQMLLEDEPERIIEVLNTKTASCGICLLLHEANKKIAEGCQFTELVSHLTERIEQTATLFVLKSLDNLVLGGRLEKIKGKIAKTLNIKLLMKATDEGAIDVSEKVRGEKKSLKRFIDQIGEYTQDTENKIITMTYCRDKERAMDVLEKIRSKYAFYDAILEETGPLISTYGGEGALVISFFKK
ncbi:DegV family protein [Oceanobacillus sp. CFH 90083]|uniref:DegV family protein n=1 Tax=Oceanobacillus sp. CFH 90083 TaxID=2592336 RepID=UPI00128C83F8|nr:DegV family protein [Oceanobacillus sp. CFH 90083]